MKRDSNTPYHYDSLFELHRLLGLPKPQHPLVSLIDNTAQRFDAGAFASVRTSSFYKISFKEKLTGKIKYGQGFYDFEDGGMFFVSPYQVTAQDDNNGDFSGYTIILHPDFLVSYPLAKKIREYGFFSYSVREALHLSTEEKETVVPIFRNIQKELQSRIDDFSQDVIVSQIDLLLNYSNRFYKRQFITRKAINSQLLEKFEMLLDEYFSQGTPSENGIPSVQYFADRLYLSPNYLSDLLRNLTGQNTQQHLHNYIIELAKQKLSLTNLSISEIAYELGFEHSQSFSRLFKKKMKMTPLEFRAGFN